jgi:hypothetical protein
MEVRSGGIKFNSVMNLLPAPPTPEVPEEEEEQESPEEEEGEDEEDADTQPATQPEGDEASSQPADPTSQPDDATSQPGRENRRGSGRRSSDQSGTRNPSGNRRAGGLPVFRNLTQAEPPGTYEDLPLILDRLTVDPSPFYRGRINVSTAPRPVLAMLDELTTEDVDAMVAARPELPSQDRSTPAWLLTRGVLDEYQFRRILPKITTSSSVYRIESIGFADHSGVQERLLVLVEMRGPIPQILYYRDLNPLGVAYNPYGLERRDRTNRAD